MQETGKYAPVNAALQMTVSASGKLVQPMMKELKYIYFNKLRILKFHLKFSETCNWILAAKVLMCLKDKGSSKWKLQSNMVHMAIKHPPTHTAVAMNCY